MAMDFPNSPVVGQHYPSPPVAGTPTYVWNGNEWTTTGGATASNVDNAVRYDMAQSLTSSQRAQARTNINAAVAEALGWQNLIINGEHAVSQQNGNTYISAVGTTGKYGTDQWEGQANGGAFGTGRISASPAPGHVYSASLQCDTAVASPAAANYAVIWQPIEMFRWQRLGWGTPQAQSITIGFWCKASIAGNVALFLFNPASPSSYVVDIAIAAANTWQYFTVTIPPDTIGAYTPGTNAAAIWVGFCIMAGATPRAATPNAWASGSFYATTNTGNLASATTQNFQFTGMTLLPGAQPVLSDHSPLFMRPYDQELPLCKRYWQNFYGAFTGYSVGVGSALGAGVTFAVEMRATPTCALQTTISGSGMNAGTTSQPTAQGVLAFATATVVSGSACAYYATFNANARM